MSDINSTAEKIAVMQAYIAGKPIEARMVPEDGRATAWAQVGYPTWDWENVEYRVAAVPLEAWCVFDRNDGFDCTCDDEQDARDRVVEYDAKYKFLSPHRAILMREVLP